MWTYERDNEVQWDGDDELYWEYFTINDDNGDDVARCDDEKTARLIVAAPELLKSLTDGATVDLPELLDWVADRMVHVYGENENIDFVLTLRHRASVCRAAINKALGETK